MFVLKIFRLRDLCVADHAASGLGDIISAGGIPYIVRFWVFLRKCYSKCPMRSLLYQFDCQIPPKVYMSVYVCVVINYNQLGINLVRLQILLVASWMLMVSHSRMRVWRRELLRSSCPPSASLFSTPVRPNLALTKLTPHPCPFPLSVTVRNYWWCSSTTFKPEAVATPPDKCSLSIYLFLYETP